MMERKHNFEVDEGVLVNRNGEYFPATITSVNGDGTYGVQFYDSTTEAQQPAKGMCAIPISVGHLYECKYFGGRNEPCILQKVLPNSMCEIFFLNGTTSVEAMRDLRALPKTHPNELTQGVPVISKHKGTYMFGEIKNKNSDFTYEIEFTNGEREVSAPLTHIFVHYANDEEDEEDSDGNLQSSDNVDDNFIVTDKKINKVASGVVDNGGGSDDGKTVLTVTISTQNVDPHSLSPAQDKLGSRPLYRSLPKSFLGSGTNITSPGPSPRLDYSSVEDKRNYSYPSSISPRSSVEDKQHHSYPSLTSPRVNRPIPPIPLTRTVSVKRPKRPPMPTPERPIPPPYPPTPLPPFPSASSSSSSTERSFPPPVPARNFGRNLVLSLSQEGIGSRISTASLFFGRECVNEDAQQHGDVLKAGILEYTTYTSTAWMKAHVLMTTDSLEIATKTFSIHILLLNVYSVETIAFNNTNPPLLSINLAPPNPFSITSESHLLLIHEDSQRETWKDLLQKWTRHGKTEGHAFGRRFHRVPTCTFLGGYEYFPQLADTLLKAKKEVFISDWWLSPEVLLKRINGPQFDESWRLDNILKKIAERGVRVFILLYAEVPNTVELGSQLAKKTLLGLHENISVSRGPFRGGGHTGLKLFYYSHHQKFVVIDRYLAFVGGIDLCWGRYNTPGSSPVDPNGEIYRGKDYYNPMISAPSRLDQPFVDQFDRQVWPRMPWQDVQLCVSGPPARDVALNFIQRWNVEMDRRNQPSGKMIPEFGRNSFGSIRVDVISAHVRSSDWNGKSDPYCVVSVMWGNLELIERRGCTTTRIINNHLKPVWAESFYFPNVFSKYPDALVTVIINIYDSDLFQTQIVWKDDFLGKVVVEGDKTMFTGEKLTSELSNSKLSKKVKGHLVFALSIDHFPDEPSLSSPQEDHNNCAQVLRSISLWSSRSQYPERSIHHHYTKLIEESKHFIYIESQFFISRTSNSTFDIRNRIADTLAVRIQKAHSNNQNFRVIILLPLTPEGSIYNSTTQAVMYWQYLTISQSVKNSIPFLKVLEGLKVPVDKFVKFFSLYTYGQLNGSLVSSQIYVHSKMIIVDDDKMIIGSQNINDRSMWGSRDSELAVQISSDKDIHHFSLVMGNKTIWASRYIHNFRMRLFQEHLGLQTLEQAEEFSNLCSQEVWDSLCLIAEKNSRIFENVFPWFPRSSYANLLTQKFQDKQPAMNTDQLQFLQGHLINFPLDYLSESLQFFRHTISDLLFQ
eukprot:TRINITY_DN27305_c0_g1_i6.p1 TRINITY_DN27305_c0_g1~~TRINITY_DN27305_c0_g1_i6.p1  ORF type:complete len:1244 (-),score=228.24 TRINITY_DN27305_c0_g1_i6:99-3830(-)